MTTGTDSNRTTSELTTRSLIMHLREVAARHAEDALAEVPAALRKMKTLLVVLTFSIPVFLAGTLVVLWRLVH